MNLRRPALGTTSHATPGAAQGHGRSGRCKGGNFFFRFPGFLLLPWRGSAMLSPRERSSGVEEGVFPSTYRALLAPARPEPEPGVAGQSRRERAQAIGGAYAPPVRGRVWLTRWEARGSYPTSIVPSSADPAGVCLEAYRRCKEARIWEGFERVDGGCKRPRQQRVSIVSELCMYQNFVFRP